MKAPWHLWVVGVLSLLWNAMGALDYTMTKLENEAYMAEFTPEQLDYFYGFPIWANFGWALGVWFAVLGSVLLLMRSKSAVLAFTASVIGMIITNIYTYGVSETSATELMGAVALYFSLAIVVIAVFLLWYARAMKIKGVLT